MNKLRTFVNSNEFEIFIQILVIFSLVSFSLGTIDNFDTGFLVWMDKTILTIFCLEYILRIFVSKKPASYILSFQGIIDLIAFLPSILFSGFDLRSVRIFRLFRLFRVLKLFRLGDASQRYIDAFKTIKAELVIFAIACCLILYISSMGIWYFEHETQPEIFGSVFDALWWSVATLTTVGYGDVFPITAGGKIFTTFVLFVGLGIIAVPSGLMASALTNATTKEK